MLSSLSYLLLILSLIFSLVLALTLLVILGLTLLLIHSVVLGAVFSAAGLQKGKKYLNCL